MADVTLKDINTINSPDTLFHAAVGSDKAPLASPESKVAAAIRRQVAVDNPRSVTERLIPKPPPSVAEAKASAEANISMDRYDRRADKWVRVPGSEADKRFNDTEKAINLAHSLLEKGYDKMGVGEQKVARETVQKALEGVWPDATTIFTELARTNPADLQVMMETFLKDPKFITDMRAGFVALKDKRLPSIPPEVRQKFEDAKHKFEDADTEHKALKKELDVAETKWDEFTAPTKPTDAGNELVRLGTLPDAQTAFDRVAREVQRWEATREESTQKLGQIRAIEAKAASHRTKEEKDLLTALKPDEAVFSGNLATANARLTALEAPFKAAREKVTRIQELQEKKKKAEEDFVRLTREESQAKLRRTRAETAMFDAQADFDRVGVDRKAMEEQYVKDWQDLMARAAETTLEGRMTEAEEARLGIAKKAIDDAFKQEMINRWNKLGKKKPELNDAMVKADFARLMDPTKGPESIVIEAIRDASLKTTGTRISEPEAKEYLLKNPDKAKAAEQAVVKELLSKVIQKGSGVKLNEEHARIIQANEWGVNALTDALEKNEAAASEIAQLRAQGLLRPDFRERLKEVAKKVPWSTLMLVLMGAAGAGFALGPTLGHLVAESGAIPVVRHQVNTWKDILGYGSKAAVATATGGGGASVP